MTTRKMQIFTGRLWELNHQDLLHQRGPCILEREHWRQSKFFGIKCFKLLSKDNNANLRKVLEWLLENLAPKFPSESEAMSLTPLPPSPSSEIAPLAHIFCLTSHQCWAKGWGAQEYKAAKKLLWAAILGFCTPSKYFLDRSLLKRIIIT